MGVSHKSFSTQTFRLMVYQRALHPELFELKDRRLHRHSDYEAETWICPSGHLARFQVGQDCLTETVIEEGDHLPEHGLLHVLPCQGEKEFEKQPKDGKIGYVTTIQTEALTDNLYLSTFREMLEFAEESQSLCHQWSEDSGHQSLSVLDFQMYRREFHIQSYHLIGSCSMVLRTQSIFEWV